MYCEALFSFALLAQDHPRFSLTIGDGLPASEPASCASQSRRPHLRFSATALTQQDRAFAEDAVVYQWTLTLRLCPNQRHGSLSSGNACVADLTLGVRLRGEDVDGTDRIVLLDSV